MFAQTSQRKLSLLGKIGVMLYGLIAGAAVWFTTLVAGFFVGVPLRGLPCRLNWDDCSQWSAWMPMVAAKLAFYPGMVVGLIVFWKVCASRFRQN